MFAARVSGRRLAVQIGVFVVVPVVWGVPVPVVEVVQVVLVRDHAMTAAIAMDVVVFGRIVRPVPLGGVMGHGRSTPVETCR